VIKQIKSRKKLKKLLEGGQGFSSCALILAYWYFVHYVPSVLLCVYDYFRN